MLWVRIPPEPLTNTRSVLVEQPGVLATLSRWRSRVQIPSGTLGNENLSARYANWQSDEAQTFVTAGSTPACATRWVVFLAAACKAVVTKQVRWMTRGSIPSRPTAEHSARSSIGRTAAPQAAKAGSIPARVIHVRLNA